MNNWINNTTNFHETDVPTPKLKVITKISKWENYELVIMNAFLFTFYIFYVIFFKIFKEQYLMDKSTNNYTIRLPKDLRDQLEKIADADSRTLSSLILKYLKEGVERDSKTSR